MLDFVPWLVYSVMWQRNRYWRCIYWCFSPPDFPYSLSSEDNTSHSAMIPTAYSTICLWRKWFQHLAHSLWLPDHGLWWTWDWFAGPQSFNTNRRQSELTGEMALDTDNTLSNTPNILGNYFIFFKNNNNGYEPQLLQAYRLPYSSFNSYGIMLENLGSEYVQSVLFY